MATREPKYAERAPDRAELEAEQQREMQEGWAGVGFGAATDAQAKGGISGALVWGAVGLVVLLPLGFIPMGGLPLAGRLLLCAIVGALAGGTFGAIYQGGRGPELEGEMQDRDGRPADGTSMRDPNTDELGR